MFGPLISPEDLLLQLDTIDAIIDCSWFLPNEKRDARREFEELHIKNAQYFDVDAVARTCSEDGVIQGLPHMLPTVEQFNSAMNMLGISRSDKVVVYDTKGIFSSPRLWFEFKYFGHADVAVLDGGLPAFLRVNGPTTDGSRDASAPYEAQENRALVRTFAQLQSCSQVVDMRSRGRFDGTAPEPRKGMSSGHRPNAINLPYAELLTDSGMMKSESELLECFQHVDLSAPITFMCGSGMSGTPAVVCSLTSLSMHWYPRGTLSWGPL